MSSKEICKIVGDNIEHFRMLRRKTIKEMAAELHLSVSGYRNIERGISEISLSKIFTIAHILNVDFTQILNLNPTSVLTDDAEKLDYNNKEAIEFYKLSIQQNKEEISFLRKQLQLFSESLIHH